MREINAYASWKNYIRGSSIREMEIQFRQTPKEIQKKGKAVAKAMDIIAKSAIQHAVYSQDKELCEEFRSGIAVGAKWYDAGLAKLPENLWRHPDKLTEEEILLYQKHPFLTTDIFDELFENSVVSKAEDTWWCVAYDCALEHHERWDGYGFPFQMEGEDIHILARICSLADSYISGIMVFSNDLRISHDRAIQYIKRNAGSQFDPILADITLRCGDELLDQMREGYF